MKSNITNSILFYLGSTILLSSCKKFVQVGDPPLGIVRSKVFDNRDTAYAAVANMYSEMMNGLKLTNGYLSKYAGLCSDELVRTSAATSVADWPFVKDSLQAADPTIKRMWADAFSIIYLANAVLEGVAGSRALSDSLKVEMAGEARFVRALSYFYLVNIFGRVPLALSTNYEETRYLPRLPEQKVYQQVITDLQMAAATLPVMRSQTDTLYAPNSRATRWAAMALLARVYLYQHNWAAAHDMAEKVITSGKFTMQGNLSEVFLKKSTETIFQLQPVTRGYNSGEAALFLPTTGKPPYAVSATLFNSMETGDARKNAWLGKDTNGPDTLYYPNKYKAKPGNSGQEYNIVLRLTEAFLIRAEASAQLGLLQGPDGAISDLNRIRSRALLPLKQETMDQASVIEVIVQERRIEFFAEWGHRWLDLKRWPSLAQQGASRLQEVMLIHRPSTWQPFLALWPIPADQLSLNDQLSQNPGYH
ncbi:RagB/SusD family nutrient uptake outer membrane protein [Paraflavitalea soli]|nr:RagB/SusD family nutrient uptake outer membrane protein [Paraflavitalea soli]